MVEARLRKVISLVVSLVVIAIMTITGQLVGLSLTTKAVAATIPPGSSYSPIVPTRIVDTRIGKGGSTLGAFQTLSVTLPTSVVPSSAVAIVANVTVTNTQSSGYLTIYPANQSRPNASEINWSTGETVPNLVTVPTGSGTIDFYNGSNGSTDVIVDVEGYYNSPSNSTGASGHYFPLPPYRIVDTRGGTASAYSGDTLGPKGTLTVNVLGKGGIPGFGVSAIVANVTVTNTTSLSYLTVWPSGTTMPTASNLNWTQGQTVANRVTVPLSQSGGLSFYNNAGNADVIVDVVGYYSDSTGSPTQGLLFNPVSVSRVVDTRSGLGGVTGPVGPDTAQTYTIAGSNGIPSSTASNPAQAVVLNLTEASTTATGGYLTVYPDGAAPPLSSDLNFSSGEVKANMDVVGLSSSGTVSIYNAQGSTQYIVDVFGYFTPAAPGADTITVTPSPSSLPADGSATSSVTIVDTSPSGAPVASQALTVSGVPSTTGVCGGLPTSVTTNSSGVASFTYTSTSTVGTCVISVSESGTAMPAVGTAVITQTAAPDVLNIIGNSGNSVVANGTSSTVLTVSDSTFAGIPVASATVSLSTTANPSGACGSIPSTVTITNGSGTVTYTSSTTPGICEIQATATGATAGQFSLAQTPGSPSSQYSISSTLPTSVVEGNTSGIYGTFIVKNGNSEPVIGDYVAIATSGVCGSVSPTQGTTGLKGDLGVLYVPSASVGTCTLTFTESQTGATTTVNISQKIAPATVELTASPGAVVTSSSTVTNTSTIGVSVDNLNGPIGADSLTISTSGPSGVCGSIASSGSTDERGLANLSYTVGTTSGVCVIKVTEAATGAFNTIGIAQVASQPTSWNKLSIQPGSASVSAGSSVSLTLTVKTLSGSVVPNDVIGFSIVGGPGCGSISSSGSPYATTDSSGQAVVSYIAGKSALTCGIQAVESATGAIGIASVTQTVAPASMTVSLNGSSPALPIAIAVSGQTGLPLDVAITLSSGEPVKGDTVSVTPISLTPTGQNVSYCGSSSLTATSGVTDSYGLFQAGFDVGPVGFCALLIGDSEFHLSSELLVVQSSNLVSTKMSTDMVAQPDNIQANGTSTSKLQVLVTNSSNVPIVNDPVVFISPKYLGVVGGSPACGVVTPSFFDTGIQATITNSMGVAAAGYQASTTALTCPVLAIEADSAFGAYTFIHQTSVAPTIPPLTISATLPTFFGGGATQAITLTVKTTSGIPFEGDSVKLNSTSESNSGVCGSSVSYLPISNGSGALTYYYTPGANSGFCVLNFVDQNGNSVNVVIDQKQAAPTSSYTVTASLSSTTLTVDVLNSNSIGVAGDPLLFSVSGPSGCSGSGPSTSDYGLTGSSPIGEFTTSVVLPPSGVTGCILNIQEANTGASAQVNLP